MSVPPDSRSDAQLVAALNAGDPTAFPALYHRYKDWILRLAHRTTGHEADALDVLQETFSYLLNKTPHLKLTAAMTTFLFPVVRNLAIAARKKRQRHEPLGIAEMDLPTAPTKTLGADESLAAALAGLSEPHREVILMRFVDDLTLEEIARILEIPLGTVKSRLHHALAILKADPQAREHL